jgi:phosphatidylserine/phosphatidylglycerophosphate/cardiolipin synthase-like enzyme
MSSSASDAVERIVLTPADRRPAVIDVINGARNQLALSLFRCDDDLVLDALAAAVRRGVHVKALLTSRAKGSKAHLKDLHALLKAAGADVRRYSDRVVRYHAKYIVADAGSALIASLNFTRKYFEATCDFVLVTNDPAVATGLTELFDADWNGAPYTPGADTTERLIVGPEHARRRFESLFASARHRIRIIDPKIDDPAMLTLLRARAAGRVVVEIRGPDGVGQLVPHGKLLMIDDDIAVMGSISLSTLALEFRRELAIVIRSPELLHALDTFWRSLPPPLTSDASAAASVDRPLSA